MQNDVCLVLCRNVSDKCIVNRAIKEQRNDIIVASDCLEIHDFYAKNIKIKKVVFIEQFCSAIDLLDDVLVLREQINKWIRHQCDNIESYMIEWIKHVEGGMTTQKILDALLLVNFYLNLINKYNPRVIYLNRNIFSIWEDEVLMQTARDNNIAIRELVSFKYILMKVLRPVVFRKKMRGIQRLLAIPEMVLFIIIKISIAFRVVTSFHKKYKLDLNKKIVLFLLGSSSEKHIMNIYVVMREVAKRNGYLPVVLCWKAKKGRIKISGQGVIAENLESWLRKDQILVLIRQYRNIRKKIYKNINSIANENISYKDVKLGKLFVSYIKLFIENDFLERLILYSASENFFSNYSPVGMYGWGGLRLDLGRICYENLKKAKDEFILFDYAPGIEAGFNCGDPPVDAFDLIFINGEYDRRYSENLTRKGNIIVSGFSRNSIISEFEKVSQEDSYNVLGIDKGDKYNILCAFNNVLSGYFSTKECYEIVRAMFDYAKRRSNIRLLLKPHPAQSVAFYSELLGQDNNVENVLIVNENSSIYHCINVSDVVITKYSTVAFEAMKFNKPVISIAIDGEKRYQDLLGDGVEKFQDLNNLLSYLDDILSSWEKYDNWKSERLIIQNNFLPQRMFQPIEPVEKIIADNIIGAICNAEKYDDLN